MHSESMNNGYPLLLLLLSALIAGCATVPAQESDFALHGEEPGGAGVFSGESGKFVFFKDSAESAETGESATQPDLSASDWEEFAAFRRWLEAREEQDQSYQEFLQWRRFEAYKAWQNSHDKGGR